MPPALYGERCEVRIAPIPVECEPARLGAFIRSTSWAKKLAEASKLKCDPVATTWSYDPRFHGGITELLNAALGVEGEQTMRGFAHIIHASTQAPEPSTPMRHVDDDDDISAFYESLVLRLEETASSRAPSSIADEHFAPTRQRRQHHRHHGPSRSGKSSVRAIAEEVIPCQPSSFARTQHHDDH